MTYKIAMIPMISPLYRLYVWDNMNSLENLDFTFYLESENTHSNIEYIPLETLNEKFKWIEIKNVFFKKEFYWQKKVFNSIFKEYDAIIFSGNPRGMSTWITSILARILGKKVYFWTHGMYGKEGKIEMFIKKLFFSIPNGIFLYENHSKQILQSQGINKNNLHVIYNSLDYDFHKEQRNKKIEKGVFKKHFNNDSPVLLFIGRLTPQKKLNQLFEAIKLIESDTQKFNVVLIGDGEEMDNLKTLSSSIKSQTWFYGSCYDESILSDLIFESDLCISPGNVGLTVIHCFSYGTPVITHGNFAYQMPEAEAIIPGKNGDYFEMDSIKDLGEKIHKWFDPNNTKNRNEIRKNCYKVIDEKYNPYYQSNLIETVLQRDLN
ncbi:glycosyltransferase [Maribacter sp. ANRC-HE7]|uniref:Glycosyltransferase n=1 Tax=Maribacter aquimaris TaxID=2737171 RepID=A0ABR7V6I5_9FLAO|nr:glycosyltransferase [Maribacter aquimaris]MBD0778832.1 glycosyltransferase [Maribacter aquimaris]